MKKINAVNYLRKEVILKIDRPYYVQDIHNMILSIY